MPAKVSLSARPIVIAGLAKDVEAVNRYAALIHAETATLLHLSFANRVRQGSSRSCDRFGQPCPVCACVNGGLDQWQLEHRVREKCAKQQPTIWTMTYALALPIDSFPRTACTSENRGVEVCAANRAHERNQRAERCYRCDRVRQ